MDGGGILWRSGESDGIIGLVAKLVIELFYGGNPMHVLSAALVLGMSGLAMLGESPIKMGLWEITSVGTSQATGKMAEVLKQSGQELGAPQTTTMKVCITAETWEKSLGGGGEAVKGCTRSDVVSTGKMVSGKLLCTVGDVTMNTDSKTYFDSSEALHGMVHLTTNSPSGTSVSDATSKGRFLGSDCGDVKPLGQMHRR